MNKVILLGRLTRDPEVRYSQGEKSTCIARFSFAVKRKFKSNNSEVDSDFFNCVAFGKQAEAMEKYVKQGNKLLITGRVENNNYTNKEGQKVYGTVISVEEFEFAEGKKTENQNDNQSASTKPNSNNTQAQSQDGFMNIPDMADIDDMLENLPFN